MGWWSSIWRERSNTWTYAEIPPEKTPEGAGKLPRLEVQPGSGYLNAFVHSFRITNVRKGPSRFYGTVHSLISLPHESGSRAEFNLLTTPSELRDLDPKNVDKVIASTRRLLGPVPYRGGDLEFEVGLFSVKSADLAAPFLTLLENLSQKAGVAYLNVALPFAGPIRDGINLLTGYDGDNILEIGLSKTFPVPLTGYFAVMRAPVGTVDTSKLRVDAAKRLVDDQSGQPVGDFPYILFSVEVTRSRPNWFEIPDIQQSYRRLSDAIATNRGLVNDALAVFRRTAMMSPDLLFEDAEKLVGEVERRVAIVVGPRVAATELEIPDQLPALQEIPLFGGAKP